MKMVQAPESGAGSADGVSATRAGGSAGDGLGGRYRLVAIVSHLGKNTGCGHYVAHVRRSDGQGWAMCNDEKIGVSSAPPTDKGYLYLFQNIEDA